MSFDEAGPVADGSASAVAFRARNGRRLELIHRKYRGAGLATAEEAELAILQKWIEDWMDKNRPLPWAMLEALEELFSERTLPLSSIRHLRYDAVDESQV